jgi:hypothetical protein
VRTSRCISGDILRDRTRNEDIRDICEIQDITRWARVRRRAWREHVNRTDDNRLAKIAKNGNQTLLGHLDGLQNAEHRGRIGALDKIQDMIPQEEKKDIHIPSIKSRPRVSGI